MKNSLGSTNYKWGYNVHRNVRMTQKEKKNENVTCNLSQVTKQKYFAEKKDVLVIL